MLHVCDCTHTYRWWVQFLHATCVWLNIHSGGRGSFSPCYMCMITYIPIGGGCRFYMLHVCDCMLAQIGILSWSLIFHIQIVIPSSQWTPINLGSRPDHPFLIPSAGLICSSHGQAGTLFYTTHFPNYLSHRVLGKNKQTNKKLLKWEWPTILTCLRLCQHWSRGTQEYPVLGHPQSLIDL